MAATQILAAALTAGTSTAVTVASGAQATVGLFVASGGSVPAGVTCQIKIDAPGANANPVVDVLTGADPVKTIAGPGEFTVVRPAIGDITDVAVGVFSDP